MCLVDCIYFFDNSIIVFVNVVKGFIYFDLSFCCVFFDMVIEVVLIGLFNLKEFCFVFCGSVVSDVSLGCIFFYFNEFWGLSVRGCV